MELEKPSTNVPPRLFGAVEPNQYNSVIGDMSHMHN
jgi:hypothetical protein